MKKKTEGEMNPVEGGQRILEQVKLRTIENGASTAPRSEGCFQQAGSSRCPPSLRVWQSQKMEDQSIRFQDQTRAAFGLARPNAQVYWCGLRLFPDVAVADVGENLAFIF